MADRLTREHRKHKQGCTVGTQKKLKRRWRGRGERLKSSTRECRATKLGAIVSPPTTRLPPRRPCHKAPGKESGAGREGNVGAARRG